MLNLDVLIDEQTIYRRIDELANQIEKDYQNEELICICILKGSFPFIWELSKRIHNDNITFAFMEISSYGNSLETSGQITVNKDISCDISGKNILIVVVISLICVVLFGLIIGFLIHNFSASTDKKETSKT